MNRIDQNFYEEYGTKWATDERRQWESMCTAHKVTKLVSLMVGLRPERILDFGCGLGEGLDLLAKHFQGKDAFGIDVSSTMINHAERQYPQYSFIIGSIEELRKKRVDLVTFFDVLEHMDDIPSVLEAAKSSADYIGIVIPLEKTWLISLLNNLHLKERKSRLYDSEGHLYEFNRSDVEMILKKAGLRILKSDFSFSPKEIQFSTYMKNRLKSKTGQLAKIKYYLYTAFSKLPYAMGRPFFRAGAGVTFTVLCKTK